MLSGKFNNSIVDANHNPKRDTSSATDEATHNILDNIPGILVRQMSHKAVLDPFFSSNESVSKHSIAELHSEDEEEDRGGSDEDSDTAPAASNFEMTETSEEIKNLIAKSTYKKVYLGKAELKAVHMNIRQKGEMNEIEKPLFDYVNTVLQYPPCVEAACANYKAATIKSYAYSIAYYVEYMASLGHTHATFKVEGSAMFRCMKEWLDVRTKNTKFETSDPTASILKFKSSMLALQELISLYELRECDDESIFHERLEQMKIIPNIYKFDNFAKQQRSRRHEISKENFFNKRRFIQSRYTIDNLKDMMRLRLEQTGSGLRKDIFDGINGILEFLLGHHFLLRSSNKRCLELSDSLWETEDTERGKMQVLGFQIFDSKTMKTSMPTAKVGCVRCKDVELCLVSAFAMSLWYRFDFEEQYAPLHGENFPDFLSKQDWYPLKVLFTSQGLEPGRQAISYNYNCKLSSGTVKNIGFAAIKKTHLGRLVNAQRADAAAIEDSQVKRAGHWSHDVAHNHYMNNYPFDFLHFSANFGKNETYRIERDIPVPLDLQRKIFPWLEDTISWVDLGTDREKTKRKPAGPGIIHDSLGDDAVLPFLHMLIDFRSIIIQDLALITDLSPSCIFSKHKIATDPLFVEFKNEMKSMMESNRANIDMKLIQSVADTAPIFTAKMEAVREVIERHVLNSNRSANELSLLLQLLSSQIQNTIPSSSIFDRLMSSLRVTIADTVSSAFSEREKALEEQLQRLTISNERLGEELEQLKKGQREDSSIVQSSPAPAKKRKVQELEAQKDDLIVQEQDTPTSSTTLGSTARLVSVQVEEKSPDSESINPSHYLSPFVSTVTRLVDEWFVSRPGLPSVEERDRLHGCTWRSKSPTYGIHKRRRALMKFLTEELMKRAEFREFSFTRFAVLVEIYRKRKNLKLTVLCTQTQQEANRKRISRELIELKKEIGFTADGL